MCSFDMKRKSLRSGGEEYLLPIPLSYSTLFLTTNEARTLLSSLEETLPHTDHFEVAGEFLLREEVLGLRGELTWKLKCMKRIPWETEGF